jgi:hypothetical protein
MLSTIVVIRAYANAAAGVFRPFFEGRDYEVLEPAWPQMHCDMKAIRRDPCVRIEQKEQVFQLRPSL